MFTSVLILFASMATNPTPEPMGKKVIMWKSESEVCVALGKKPGCLELVTSTGFGVKWIGKISQMEFVFDEDKPYDWPPTGKVKVIVTWFSSESHYECGHEYDFDMDDLKDVEARSLMVKKCR